MDEVTMEDDPNFKRNVIKTLKLISKLGHNHHEQLQGLMSLIELLEARITLLEDQIDEMVKVNG